MADESTPSKVKELFSSFLSASYIAGDADDKRKGVSLLGEDRTISNGDGNQHECAEESNAFPYGATPILKNDTSPGLSDSRKRREFYTRVATYSPVTWCAKPLDISPLVCARYGWENVDTDMLQCSHCRVFLSGELPKTVDSEAYRDSYSKLKQNITESHEKLCKWSSTPSPESFTQVPYHSTEEVYSNFCARVLSLRKIENMLPEVSYEFCTDISAETILREELHGIVEQILNHLKAIEIECSEAIAVYSITGWEYCEPQKGVHILQCNYCCCKVGLWNYSKVNATKNDTSTDEPLSKKLKLEKNSFDPIAGHRYWCPWLQMQYRSTTGPCQSSFSPLSSPGRPASPSSNSSADKQNTEPAWLYVSKLLSRYKQDGNNKEFITHMKQSPQVEGLRHIRRVLRDCTSPPSPRKTNYGNISPGNKH